MIVATSLARWTPSDARQAQEKNASLSDADRGEVVLLGIWRADRSIYGRSAFHEGVDFTATTGTPIKAAASGVVVYSDYHPEYGNMIDVDHGNEFVSRYAHASKRLVKVGQVVVRGQKIAEGGQHWPFHRSALAF